MTRYFYFEITFGKEHFLKKFMSPDLTTGDYIWKGQYDT